MNNIIKHTPPVFATFVQTSPSNIAVTPLNNAQPWRLFFIILGEYKTLFGQVWNCLSADGIGLLVRFFLKSGIMRVYYIYINLPLSCHLVGSRLGRKNRLLDGFFISALSVSGET